MIKDIVEKNVGVPKPPSAPKAQAQPSLWKQRATRPKAQTTRSTPARDGPTKVANTPSPAPRASAGGADMPPMTEQEEIHLENLKKMSQMSREEIEKERQELIDSMDADVLSSLLKRAEIKEMSQQEWDGNQESPAAAGAAAAAVADQSPRGPSTHPAYNEVLQPPEKPQPCNKESPDDQTWQGLEQENASLDSEKPDSKKSVLHFPPPPEELKKYFPDTPIETSKLAWMQPVAPEEELEYSEELASVAPSQLRFDFRGNLLTPRNSSQIDTSLGLHHHADAPGAAGYTIPELAHLARSSHASQRSLAIQTLGRVLHKLVNGKYNKSSELQYALEKLVQSTRVEETLLEAASDNTRSLTVRTHATEALWLYHNKTKPAHPPAT